MPKRSWAMCRGLVIAACLAGAGSAMGCTSGSTRPGGMMLDGGGDARTIDRRCMTTTDSDSDSLFDEFEQSYGEDWERDGIPNHLDPDSDDDGISDSEEAGPGGGCSARDTDGDAVPDFLDLDSDGDGLSDREERTRYFTDPYNEDSDGDGFVDVAEVATGHDPLNPDDGIPPEDFYVVLPYEGPEQLRDLTFSTNVRQADVFFMMDRTGSMSEEAGRLRSSLGNIVREMTMRIRDVGVGVGGFAGFGGPAGSGGMCMTIIGIESCDDGPRGDVPFNLYGVITTDVAQMQRDVDMLRADQGGATWASSNEALYQAATGAGIAPWVPPQRCAAIPDETRPRIGYPCFRPGSLPIMVVMTDTSSKNGPMTTGVSGGTYNPARFTMGPPPHTYDESLASLRGIGARVIGVISGEEVSRPTAIAQFREWATQTGTVDGSGAPITFMIGSDGSGLDTRIIEAVRILAEETPQDISATSVDGEDFPAEIGPVDATRFIKNITPARIVAGGIPTECPSSGLCDDRLFYSVTPGATVEFRVRFLNDFQPPRPFSQVFRAEILVLGNGVAELDSRDVVIVVPSGSIPDLI